MVICLERGADLHIAQLMPLPLTVSCSSKIQIAFTFLVPAHPGRLGQRAVKRVWGIFKYIFVANLPLSLPSKEFKNRLTFMNLVSWFFLTHGVCQIFSD